MKILDWLIEFLFFDLKDLKWNVTQEEIDDQLFKK